MADLQLLCPIIGDRLRLEEEIKFIRADKLYPDHEPNVVQFESKVSNAALKAARLFYFLSLLCNWLYYPVKD